MTFPIPSRLSAPLARFAREERAALSIEAAIMLPVLTLIFVMGYQYFDQYRREAHMTKASYAVADMLSRRLSIVTPHDLNGLESVYETLTYSENLSYMRFTEVRRRNDNLEVIWSFATDGQPAMTDAILQGFLNQVPRLDENERVTLVESYTFDRPYFNVGLGDRIIPNFVPISQRYAARLAFAPEQIVADDNISIIANDTDCGDDVVLVNGLPLIGAGNCTADEEAGG
ncbi:TadE/TadG family type IV pilus assembly protein [Jannaschia marina]|uniref:TadE/TadG family type IV pilus assembly protein n=1 Tax=Jannaschia marina TaxID=2741674 RepID=UPI0015CD4220|nr:hypothetical protein [Jannaschia marina]